MDLKNIGRLLLNRLRRGREFLRYLFVKPERDLVFYIVSAQMNSGEAATKCLSSVYNQKWPKAKIKHVFIDDASTDSTDALICQWLHGHLGHQVEYIRNSVNRGICRNLHEAFSRAPIGSIILQLDGDDWLPDGMVLDFLARVYASSDVWATYNSWCSSDGKRLGQTRMISPKVISANSLRKAPWVAGALRTFRAELYRHVPEKYLRDPDTGDWWSYTADQAYFLAVLELAGTHYRHLHRITYIYYIREHTGDNRYIRNQEDCKWRIREFPPLSPLRTL